MYAAVLKFNPNHDPATGRFASGPGSAGAGFVSPSVGQGGRVADAQRDLSGPRHVEVAQVSRQVDDMLGLKATHVDAVGAWADGAEDTLMVRYSGHPSYDQVRTSLAMKGLLADQKAVIPFRTEAGGPDSMYHLDVPEHDLGKINQDLVGLGLDFHTMEPHLGGTRVWVFDPGSELKDKALAAGEHYGTTVSRWKGRGEFLGSWDSREEGRQAYEQVITDARQRGILGPDGGRRWEELRDRWRSTHPALKYAQVLKWDEEQHPRVSAGSSDGGEFTDGEGGGAGGGTPAQQKQRYLDLKGQWAKVNNDLLADMDTPASPDAQQKMDELKGIVKQMNALSVDQGGAEGIGLPGGPRDVVVVGAGPGGLAAGTMAGTDGLDTLVIEASPEAGGQARFSSRIENFPGFPVGVTGEQLARNMLDQSERVGADVTLGKSVTGMSYDDATGLKTLTLSDGSTVVTRSVILAGGVQFNTIDFPGSSGSNVIYGDGKTLSQLAAGSSALVIGGSNGAAQAALGAAQSDDHVYLLSRSSITKGMSDYQVQAVRANPKITVIENDSIQSLTRDSSGTPVSATTSTGRTIPVKAVGIFAGSGPKTNWLPPSVQRTGGKVVVDGNLQTAVPGVFAIGDVRVGSIGRIGAAVGDGQMASKHAWDYLDSLRKKSAAPRRKGNRLSLAERNRTVDRLFELDREYPFFGQTVEAPSESQKWDSILKWDEMQHPRDERGRFDNVLRLNQGRFASFSDAEMGEYGAAKTRAHPQYNHDKTGYPTPTLDQAARAGIGVKWTNGELAKFMALIKRKAERFFAILKYANQPRVPAGSTTGGQFASDGTSGPSYSALDRRLIEVKPDRPLHGAFNVTPIDNYIPGMKSVPYSKVPFLAKMHQMMGVSDPETHDIDDYVNRRNALFSKQDVHDVEIKDLIGTQTVVNHKEIGLSDTKGRFKTLDALSKGYPLRVVQYQGKQYLMDGHHRAVSYYLAGMRKVPADVLNLDAAKKWDWVLKAGWDESQHPREPAGTQEGGEFAGGVGARGAKLANVHARALLLRAHEADEQLGISDTIRRLKPPTAKMEGWDHRYKTEDSLTRKIHDEAIQEGISYQAKANAIGDALRYTIASPDADYLTHIQQMVDHLRGDGYQMTKFKNYWGRKDDMGNDPVYQGVNTNWKAPNGQVFELQFHTPESWHVKDVMNHALFSQARLHSTGPEEDEQFFAKMRENQRRVPVPHGIVGFAPK